MNKWIVISVVCVLVAGLAASLFLYFQESSNLKAAKAEIVTLEGTVSTLEGIVTRLETELAAAEADVTRLETELAAAEAEVSNLQADLEAAQTEVSTLSEELSQIRSPRHFASLSELNSWLAQDDTDTEYGDRSIYEYIYILQVRALRDGYLLPANFEDFDFDYIADIAGNLAYIGDEIYLVWPFEDSYELWFLAIDIPSRPLPLE